jgi:hypothetical protein
MKEEKIAVIPRPVLTTGDNPDGIYHCHPGGGRDPVFSRAF